MVDYQKQESVLGGGGGKAKTNLITLISQVLVSHKKLLKSFQVGDCTWAVVCTHGQQGAMQPIVHISAVKNVNFLSPIREIFEEGG